MLRIITGKYKGRNLKTLKDKNLRPTTSMAKEALFNILRHHDFGERINILEDAVIGDLFCGSGALGFEALSRGAKFACFIDKNPKHLQIARENAEHIGAKADCAFILSDSTSPPIADKIYDIIFLDPPYGENLIPKTLENLAKNNWLSQHTIVIIECGLKDNPTINENYEILLDRHYGVTRIIICHLK